MVAIEDFFCLDEFPHKGLLKEKEPVWSPLYAILSFLEKAVFKIEVEIPEGVFLRDKEKIGIGEGTILEPGVYIQGPALIGKNCKISHGAYLRGGVILGDGCVVGHSSEIKHSILLKGAHATHFTYVGDSILGSRVNLGAGVKCANLRLDRHEISLFANGIKYATGLKKMGAIIGDDSQIGCNCVINPGTLIRKGSFFRPLSDIRGVSLNGKKNDPLFL